MIFGNDPAQYRNFFRDTWRKHREGLALEPMETMVAHVIAGHPEYHALLETQNPDNHGSLLNSEDGNPFLHMGLHIAIQEQLTADRPAGIRSLYHQLAQRHGDLHDMEHRMAECLAECLWEAQRNNLAPDEQHYLDQIRRL